jgi:hypothetical protein
MEAVARRRPAAQDELLEMKELRRWQAEVLGAGFLKALAQEGPAPATAAPEAQAGAASPAKSTTAPARAPAREPAKTTKAPAKAPAPADTPYRDA